MANANFDSTSLTSKAISVVVAIVVFACVFVPVIGSMAGGGDGGGGTVTYTNVGDYYYKSATADSEEHTILIDNTQDSSNNEITLSTTVITVDGVEVYSNTEDADILQYRSPYVFFGWNEHGPIEYNESVMTLYYWQAGNRLYMDGALDNHEEGDTFERTVISFSISDGNIVGVDEEEESVPVIVPIEYFISSDGEYVLADSPVVSVIENMDIGVMLARYTTSTTPGDWEDWTALYILEGWIESESITADVQNITSVGIYTTAEQTTVMDYSVILNSMSNGNIRSIESIDVEVYLKDVLPRDEVESEDIFTNTQFIVPTTVTVPAEGGDSDSGHSPMVKTLIGIIPVFVALGLILAIVGMFYNPNRMN